MTKHKIGFCTEDYASKNFSKDYLNKKIQNFSANTSRLYYHVKLYSKNNNLNYEDFLNSEYAERYIKEKLSQTYPNKKINIMPTGIYQLHTVIKFYCSMNHIKNHIKYVESLGYTYIEKGKYTKKYIKQKLKNEFPNKVITGISKYRTFYCGVRAYCQKNDLNFYDFLESLGYTVVKNANIIFTKKYIIEELEKEYPNKVIKKITSNSNLYEGIVRYCNKNNIPDYREFLRTLGYEI